MRKDMEDSLLPCLFAYVTSYQHLLTCIIGSLDVKFRKKIEVYIIFDPHNDKDEYWIKRIIGLPGETVQIIGDDIYINGEKLEENYGKDPIEYAGFVQEPYTLAENEYFVMGDNRCNSTDSRIVGPIKEEDIGGRVCFLIWPLNEFGVIKNK